MILIVLDHFNSIEYIYKMPKLPHGPLQEVIFEIRWSLEPSQESGQLQDSGFELASGRLHTILENQFPFYRRIVMQEIPDQLLFYRPVHQYWTSENTWPVLQLGPGIFTVNCTDQGYDWEETFRPLIEKAVEWLMQSYREPVQLAFASLRYINTVKVNDYGGLSEGWQAFILKNFNVEYNNLFNTRGRQRQIQINQTFELEDVSELQIQMSDGTKNNEPALVWQTAVFKKQNFTTEKLLTWADTAHSITHDLFVEMLKPHFYASFSREN